MPKIHLSDIAIKNLKPKERQITYLDDTLPGFGIRISPGGTKTFTLMYGNQRKLLTIGRYPIISLSQARNEAKKVLAAIILGTYNQEPVGLNFEDALILYLDTHCTQHFKERHLKEARRILEKHFLPYFRRKPLSDIATQDISLVIDRLLSTPAEANNAFNRIRAFFTWCSKRKYIPRSPCEGMTLPTRPKSRSHVISDEDLPHIYRSAEQYGYAFGHVIQLLFLTGQRRGEIAALKWDYIYDDIITLPASLTKNNRDHTFPITPVARQIIEKTPRIHDYLFPAKGSQKPLSGFTTCKRKLDAIYPTHEQWVIHDLRRTVATNLAELETPPHVVERILNHSTGTISGVAAIYNRFQYMDEMRDALTKWEQKLTTLLKM